MTFIIRRLLIISLRASDGGIGVCRRILGIGLLGRDKLGRRMRGKSLVSKPPRRWSNNIDMMSRGYRE